jgi:alpha-mannosidase
VASGPTEVRILVKENGPLLASLVAESKAEGCNWLKREVRLVAGQPQVEIINTLDKLAITAKEGIHFGFAFDIPDPRMRADIPWGIMEVEKDQFPEGNRNWICFQRWLDIANGDRGVVWTSPEAPTFQVGGMTANILGGAHNSPEWIRTLQPSGTVYSWALNNHWHGNFPLFQEGVLTFTYQILPRATGYDSSLSNRFGMEQARPLVAAPVKAGFATATPVAVDNPAVVVSSLRQSRDGKALVLCLRSVSDKAETANLTFPTTLPKSLHLCLADQAPAEKTTPAIALPPHGVVTVRMEF